MNFATATADDVRPETKPYVPYGVSRELWFCNEPEVIISGPAGTGKSRACLEKIHYCAETYPGCRGLIVRKTRESLTESALVTFEEKVVPANHRILHTGGQRRVRQAYHYPNGSAIVVGGMDKPSKIMSTEYDFVFVQEASELLENDWESLTTRLRNNVMPQQQLLADTNPDSPQHWLKQRESAGRIKFLESRHEDNPLIWDARRGTWTERGADYISKLDNLTAVRKERLRYGRWVQAEGVVYDNWDRRIHLIDRFTIPNDWPRYWSIDFGFTAPFVCQWWAQDRDGRLYRYREIYRTQRLVEDHAREILRLSGWKLEGGALRAVDPQVPPEPRPRAIICDHDAEGRATLLRHLGGLQTVAARKEITRGIQAVTARLQVAGDGKPRLFLLRDSLVGRDPVLVEKKLPLCTEEEIDGYVWSRQTPRRPDGNNDARKKWEEPVDRDNHGLDALRYLVANLDFATTGSAIPFTMEVAPTMDGYAHRGPSVLSRITGQNDDRRQQRQKRAEWNRP